MPMLHAYPEIELIRYGDLRIAKKLVKNKYLYLVQRKYRITDQGEAIFRTERCWKTFAGARQCLKEWLKKESDQSPTSSKVSDRPHRKRLIKKR